MKFIERIIWPITAALLIICGVVCIVNLNNAKIIPLTIGIFMLISGVLNLVLYFLSSRVFLTSGYLLVQGVASIAIAILLLALQEHAFNAIFVCFGIYVLVSGGIKLLKGLQLKIFQVKNYQIYFIEGAILILVGLLCFFARMLQNNIMVIILGIYLIVLGFSELTDYIEELKKNKPSKESNNIGKSNGAVLDAEVIDEKDTKSE